MLAHIPMDDWQLLRDARDAFSGLDTLFDRHKDYVFRLAWGFLGSGDLAEDVTQEVFLRIAQGRQRWRARAKFRTLLYQVTLNTCREIRRRRAKESRLSPELDPVEGPVVEVPDSRLVDLADSLSTLSDRQREAVVLRFFEGCSTKEAAKIMGCREGTVKSHLHRALEALRLCLEPDAAISGSRSARDLSPL